MDTTGQTGNNAFNTSPLHHPGNQPCSEMRTINFTPRTYKEEIEEKGTEPEKRSLDLVLRLTHRKWHIKLTFRGTSSGHIRPLAKVSKRRKDLENLCHCINFGEIRLLDDTVTELIVTLKCDATTTLGYKLPLKTSLEASNVYYPGHNHLWLYIQEDPFRVRYPVYHRSESRAPIKRFSDIREKQELSPGVYKTQVGSDETWHVYKEVERPLYVPRDTEVLEQELHNLQLLRGSNGVVQLTAVVVSKNPYQTHENLPNEAPDFLRGILLEYHSNGTLANALESSTSDTNYPWQQWAVEITSALARLHELDITLMDLKPENIVIGEYYNAILIDVSGIGGVTRKWLSPEMKDTREPLSQDIDSRVQNDIWALGKVLLAMADVSCNDVEAQLLREVALEATAEIPPRIPLQSALFKLSYQLHLIPSEFTPINTVRVESAV